VGCREEAADRALAIAVATWAKSLPWLQVARHFQCSWGRVAASVAYVVAFGLARRDLSDIIHIGIGEISRRKGHVYLTNVYDLKTGTLIWSGEGRTKETLNAFFDFFGKERTANLIKAAKRPPLLFPTFFPAKTPLCSLSPVSRIQPRSCCRSS